MAEPLPRCLPCSTVAVPDRFDWAATVGGAVARRYHLRGQERADVIGAAHVALLKIMQRTEAGEGFDPSRVPEGADHEAAFRGWAYLTLRCSCVREALRIRSGGMFRSVRPENVFSVCGIGENAARMLHSREEPAEIVEDVTKLDTINDWLHESELAERQLPPDTNFGRRLATGE